MHWHAWLLPGFALSLLSLLAYAARFRRVMHMLDLDFSYVDGLRIVSFAVFCQFFLPLGAGAELSKFFKLRGLAQERHALVSAAGIALEHVLGLAALVTMASGLWLALQPLPLTLPALSLVLAAVLIVALGTAVILRVHSAVGLKAAQILMRLAQHRRDALSTVLWSILMHALLAAAVFVGSFGWGIAIGYGQILFVLSCAAVFHAVPANLVGVGAADLAGTGLYIALGLPLAKALLLVSLLYGYRLLAALLGGLWALHGARRRWRADG